MAHARYGLPWTGSEVGSLRNLYSQGKSIREIAKALGRANDAVAHKLIETGVVGFQENYLPLRHGLPWSSKEVQMLQQEYAAGKSVSQIATSLQREKNAILHRLINFSLFDYADRNELERLCQESQGDAPEMPESVEIKAPAGTGRYTGGETMPGKKTKTVDHKPSLIGRITGKDDAMFLKNQYQGILDERLDEIHEYTKYLEVKSGELKDVWAKIPAVKKNIEAHEKERAQLYSSLENILTKETDFEHKMWETTQKGRKVKSITVKNKFKDSDVDEMRYDSMMDYLEQYPKYHSKSSITEIVSDIKQKESEIRKETERYNALISDYNFRINTFEKDIQKGEDKFESYNKVRKEGEERVSNAGYNKGVFRHFQTEQEKAETNLDLFDHQRMDQLKNTMNLIKGEFFSNKKKVFTDMEY